MLIDCAEPVPAAEEAPILKPGRTDTELEEQVEKYCARHVQIDEKAGEVTLPRLLRVFRDDFGASEAEMVSWLSQYIPNAPPGLVNYRVKFLSGVST